MQSSLSAEHYISEAVFRLEQERIFGKLWIFAGLRTLLAKPDAYLARRIGGIPVVLQNFDGAIRAFENQCRHRQMPLQDEKYGHRRLQCRYHGWAYASDGHVAAIPSRETLYRFTDADFHALRLRQYAVEEIGNLVFVNVNEHPIPLAEQFRPAFVDRLAEASSNIDDEAAHTRIDARYNWKLNFENVLDYNHVAFLHPRTFLPLMEDVPAPQTPVPLVDPADVACSRLPDLSYEAETPFRVSPRPWHAKVRRGGAADKYYNFFIYPNVNFISIGGLVFLIQQFDPIAPAATEVAFTLALATKTQRLPVLPAVLWEHMKGEKRVLDEDVQILERLQATLHTGSPPAFHGAYELPLMRQAAVYRNLMGFG